MKLKKMSFVISIVFLQFCLSICCFAEENSKDKLLESYQKNLKNLPEKTMVKTPATAENIYYYNAAMAIVKNWKFESNYLDSGLEVIVVLKIIPNGNIEEIKVEKESASKEFNDTVYNTIRKSNPLEPFPKEITKPYFDAEFRFTPEGKK